MAMEERMYLITSRSGQMLVLAREPEHVHHYQGKVLTQSSLLPVHLVPAVASASDRPKPLRIRVCIYAETLKNASHIPSRFPRVYGQGQSG